MKKIILLLWFLCFLCFFAVTGRAVVLEWDANSETNVAGYRVYVGPSSRNYTSVFTNWGRTNTVITITNSLLWVGTNFFAVTAFTAFDEGNLESDYSDEVTYTKTNLPAKPTGLRFRGALTVQSSERVSGAAWTNVAEVGWSSNASSQFFRLVMSPPEPAAVTPTLRPGKLRPAPSKAGKLI